MISNDDAERTRARPGDGAGLLFRVAFALFAAVVLAPLALYFSELTVHPIRSLSGLFSPMTELGRLGRLLAGTVLLAAMASTLALAMAVALFAAFEPLAASLRRPLWVLASLAFLMPGHFEAIAWIQTLGRAGWLTSLLHNVGLGEGVPPAFLYSSFGCASVMALHYFPLLAAVLWIGRYSAPRAVLEASATFATPARFWSTFVLGWLRPWCALGWLIAFIAALLDFSIPSLLRRRVFTVEIMTAFNIHYDPARAMALAVPLLIVSLVAAGLLARLLLRVRIPGFVPGASRLPRIRGACGAVLTSIALAVCMASALGPLANFALMAGGWAPFETILASARSQIVTSLLWSSAAAAACTLLSAVLASVSPPRSLESPSARGLLVRSIAPAVLVVFALPASIVALSQIGFWNRRPLALIGDALHGGGLMLLLGHLTLFLPPAYLILRSRLAQTPEALEDLSRLAPLTPAARWRWLLAPRLARPGLIAAALVFVLAMQEVHAAMLLVAPGQETLSIRAFTLLHYAPDSLVAAFCLTTLAVALAALAVLAAAALALRFICKKAVPDVDFG